MINRVKIEIIGKNPDYYLKEMIYHKINIYHLEKQKNKLIVIINEKDYQELLKRKTTYKIRVIRRYGVGHITEFLKKYYLLLIFTILGIIGNKVLSNMILDIELIHPNQQLIKRINKDLKEYGIERFHWKKTYEEREKIKKKILEKEKDNLEWLEINEIGTKYQIILEERKIVKEEIECAPRSIIAKKNAILLDIKAEKGEVSKKKKDYVTKGEVIISGLIHNKEDIVSKKCAEGVVYGETWYTIKAIAPKEKKNIQLEKDKKIGITIKIFKKEWVIGQKIRTFQKKEYNLIDSIILPIHISIDIFQRTTESTKEYSEEEVEKMVFEKIEKEFQKNWSKEEEILLKKVLKKTENNSKIELEVFVKAKENITDYMDISSINIEEENKKEE